MRAFVAGVGLLGVQLIPSHVASAVQAPELLHSAVRCVVAEKFPRFEAQIRPSEAVARARVYFRAEATPHWYFVEMKPAAESFSGVLPRPRKTNPAISYYVEVLTKDFASQRTPEYKATVTSGPGLCPDLKAVAASLGSAAITLGVPAGAPAVPAGFASTGIAAAGGGGAGISAGKVALIGGGAAAAAGAVVVATQGESLPARVTEQSSGVLIAFFRGMCAYAGEGGQVSTNALRFTARSAGAIDATANFSVPAGSPAITLDLALTSVPPGATSFPAVGPNVRGAGPTLTGTWQAPAAGEYQASIHQVLSPGCSGPETRIPYTLVVIHP